jgi:hypothetical protein
VHRGNRGLASDGGFRQLDRAFIRPFIDVDTGVYLFYTARGEDAIGVARLTRAFILPIVS